MTSNDTHSKSFSLLAGGSQDTVYSGDVYTGGKRRAASLPAEIFSNKMFANIKRTKSPKRSLRPWTAAEDEMLKEAVALYGKPNWAQIAKHVKTRNNKMCAQRWNNCLDPTIKNVKKGTWSREEDEKLREIVSKCARKDGSTWALASKGMGYTRNKKQCRERWVNFLDPRLRTGPWTDEEDKLLLQLQQKFGNSWIKFTETLVGRTAERIRRRFLKIKK